MNNPFVGFVPWIIFWVVSSPSTWEWATLGALIAAVILAVPSAERGGLKILDIGTIAFFAVLSLLAIFLDRGDITWLEDYSQAISSGALAIIALGSLAVTPFTEQYARESTPREVWDTPRFKRTNFVLSAVWGAVFAVGAILGVIAQETDSSTAREWLNWIIPIALVIGGFKFTAWYAARARAHAAGLTGAPAGES
jgi:tryptophan-rich sensory protein